MKFRKKTTATLLIALFMISTFAVMANAEIKLIEDGSGTTKWVQTPVKEGSWSVELFSGVGHTDVGRIFVPITPILLQELEEDPTFWVLMPVDFQSGGSYVEGTGLPVEDGDGYFPFGIPYINICLDLEGNGVDDPETTNYDDKLEAMGSSAGGTTIDGGIRASLPPEGIWTEVQEAWGYYDTDVSMGASGFVGGIPAAWNPGTLEEWKFHLLGEYPLAEVVGVEITNGYWAEGAVQEQTAYVDDIITVGTATYPIEPDAGTDVGSTTYWSLTVTVVEQDFGSVTQIPVPTVREVAPFDELGYPDDTTVDLLAIPETGYELVSWAGVTWSDGLDANIFMDGEKTVTATFRRIPTLSINVDVTSIDLSGTMGLSYPVVDTITVSSNEFDEHATLTAEIIGDEPDKTWFETNILIDSVHPPGWPIDLGVLTPDDPVEVPVGIDLSLPCEAGTYSATLIFWAEATP